MDMFAAAAAAQLGMLESPVPPHQQLYTCASQAKERIKLHLFPWRMAML
jgi:hypothetical protein